MQLTSSQETIDLSQQLDRVEVGLLAKFARMDVSKLKGPSPKTSADKPQTLES